MFKSINMTTIPPPDETGYEPDDGSLTQEELDAISDLVPERPFAAAKSLFSQPGSVESRAADRLFSATETELNLAYRPGTTDFDNAIEELLQDPAARAAYDRQAEIIKAARQIREWREYAGLTKRELAERLRVDETVISRMESSDNDVLPTTGEMRNIAWACGKY